MITKDGRVLYGPKRMLPENIGDYVERSDACWLWLGTRDKYGYGRITRGAHGRLAHRVVYEMLVGPIPAGKHLHHECHAPACVNPEHLRPLSNAEHQELHGTEITHCLRGHPYDESNTYRHPRHGRRMCRACHRLAAREYAARVRARAAVEKRREGDQ